MQNVYFSVKSLSLGFITPLIEVFKLNTYYSYSWNAQITGDQVKTCLLYLTVIGFALPLILPTISVLILCEAYVAMMFMKYDYLVSVSL